MLTEALETYDALPAPRQKEIEAPTWTHILAVATRQGIDPYLCNLGRFVKPLSFLKWYYKMESVMEADDRAARDGVLEAVFTHFKVTGDKSPPF